MQGGIDALTGINRCLLSFGSIGIAGCNETNHVRIVGEPAVARYLKQICTLPWVGYEYAFEKVSCVWCNIFGEREWCGYDVLVQKIDVVALGIRWVVVERKVAGQHGILYELDIEHEQRRK